jgi:hypothetical protein
MNLNVHTTLIALFSLNTLSLGIKCILISVAKCNRISSQVRVCVLNVYFVELNAQVCEDENHHGKKGQRSDTLHIISFVLFP